MDRQVALNIDRNWRRRGASGRWLTELGFAVHRASDAETARRMLQECCYLLILMHFETLGREICKICSFARSANSRAIIIALMAQTRIAVEANLFESGANDVVAGQQTAAQVLTKRIKAHLHNNSLHWGQANIVRLKGTMIDFSRREVWRNGATHKLPGTLPELLRYFLNNPNRVISREELKQSPIWAESICSSPDEGGKTFDVSIGKLRKLIEPDPAQPQIIVSVRGIGWKLVVEAVDCEWGKSSGLYSTAPVPKQSTSESPTAGLR